MSNDTTDIATIEVDPKISDHPIWDEMVAEFGDPLDADAVRTSEQDQAVARSVATIDAAERRSPEKPLTVVKQPAGTVAAPRTPRQPRTNPRSAASRKAAAARQTPPVAPKTDEPETPDASA